MCCCVVARDAHEWRGVAAGPFVLALSRSEPCDVSVDGRSFHVRTTRTVDG